MTTLISRKAVWATAIGGILVASPAFATNGSSTSHLNLRTGPGTQYPIAGNTPARRSSG